MACLIEETYEARAKKHNVKPLAILHQTLLIQVDCDFHSLSPQEPFDQHSRIGYQSHRFVNGLTSVGSVTCALWQFVFSCKLFVVYSVPAVFNSLKKQLFQLIEPGLPFTHEVPGRLVDYSCRPVWLHVLLRLFFLFSPYLLFALPSLGPLLCNYSYLLPTTKNVLLINYWLPTYHYCCYYYLAFMQISPHSFNPS